MINPAVVILEIRMTFEEDERVPFRAESEPNLIANMLRDVFAVRGQRLRCVFELVSWDTHSWRLTSLRFSGEVPPHAEARTPEEYRNAPANGTESAANASWATFYDLALAAAR